MEKMFFRYEMTVQKEGGVGANSECSLLPQTEILYSNHVETEHISSMRKSEKRTRGGNRTRHFFWTNTSMPTEQKSSNFSSTAKLHLIIQSQPNWCRHYA